MEKKRNTCTSSVHAGSLVYGNRHEGPLIILCAESESEAAYGA